MLTVLVLGSSACQGRNSQATQPSASPTIATETTASQPPPAATATPHTYRNTQNLFEISLPEGYSHRETSSGIIFASPDDGFGGAVDFSTAQGQQFSAEQLEAALKQEYTKRLKQIAFQKSQIQEDGSMRVDWLGRNSDGQNLDAVSFVEQRGDHVFILTLFGVNKPYGNYNDDAGKIVDSYRIRK